MKKILDHLKKITLTCSLAAAGLAIQTIHADTTNTFNFQQRNLTKDGSYYGSGASYVGMSDGSINDGGGVSTAYGSTGTVGIGNQYQATAPQNGQNFVGLFAYDLTELNEYIAACTSATSTAQVVSVSLQLIANGGSTNTSPSLYLYQTEPFTTSANWTNTGYGVNWSAPWQSGLNPSNSYSYTGGGSKLSVTNIAGSAPYVAASTVLAGTANVWSNSDNFVQTISNALLRTDHKLYLMAAPSSAYNGDGRLFFRKSSDTTLANRPVLQIAVQVIGTPSPSSSLKWTGSASGTWDSTTTNWNDALNYVAYADGKNVTFDDTLSTTPATNNVISLSATYSPSNIIANNSTYSYSLTGGGLAGNMSLTKLGTNVFSLGMANSYSGLTTVSAGTLLITQPNALGSTASGTVVASGAALVLSNGITLSGEPLTLNGNGNTGANNNGALHTADTNNPVTVACPITLGSDARIATSVANGRVILTGPITDNGSNYNLSLTSGQGGSKLDINTANNTVGAVTLYTFQTTAGLITFGVNNTFPSSLLQVGAGLFDLNGTSQSFAGIGQGVTPTGGVITNSSATVSTLTLNVPATTNYSAQSGIQGNIRLVMNGPGTQSLTGGTTITNSYTGTTTVNGGILGIATDMSRVTNSFIVNNGGTLRGSGSVNIIGGPVTVNAGGTFYAGFSSNSLGILNISNTLSLAGNTIVALSKSATATLTNDIINVSGSLGYGGTLTVYNIGTNALALGDSFPVFKSGGTGSFTSVVGDAGVGQKFQFSDGVISVVASMANYPTNITTQVSGNTLTLSWPSTHLGWYAQSNSVSLSSPTDWHDVPGSQSVTSLPITINPANPNVFYRLSNTSQP